MKMRPGQTARIASRRSATPARAGTLTEPRSVKAVPSNRSAGGRARSSGPRAGPAASRARGGSPGRSPGRRPDRSCRVVGCDLGRAGSGAAGPRAGPVPGDDVVATGAPYEAEPSIPILTLKRRLRPTPRAAERDAAIGRSRVCQGRRTGRHRDPHEAEDAALSRSPWHTGCHSDPRQRSSQGLSAGPFNWDADLPAAMSGTNLAPSNRVPPRRPGRVRGRLPERHARAAVRRSDRPHHRRRSMVHGPAGSPRYRRRLPGAG
jgi:hypothetical protein